IIQNSVLSSSAFNGVKLLSLFVIALAIKVDISDKLCLLPNSAFLIKKVIKIVNNKSIKVKIAIKDIETTIPFAQPFQALYFVLCS
ncbi:hypothetical protein CP02DC14_1954, partial [Chlamydia psittaci 02DC14]